MSDDRPVNRRGFFLQGFRELLKPMARAIDPIEKAAQQLGAWHDAPPRSEPAETQPIPEPQPQWLRPPGALPEGEFAKMCSKCGDCVRVCPVKCIQIDADGVMGNGPPYIDADLNACTMCEGLQCMSICPTGALKIIPRGEIKMGTAQLRPYTCLRITGEACQICIDKCPVGAKAIELVDGYIQVNEEGCTGCGQCQQHCPTSPKSIVVIPKWA